MFGVPLTGGSKHHHYLLVRHVSGSGTRGPEKLGGAGWAAGPGVLALNHARAPKGAAAKGGRDPRPLASPPGLTPPPQPESRTLAPTCVTPSPRPGWETPRIMRGRGGRTGGGEDDGTSMFAAEPTRRGGDVIPRRLPTPARSFIPALARPPLPGRPAHRDLLGAAARKPRRPGPNSARAGAPPTRGQRWFIPVRASQRATPARGLRWFIPGNPRCFWTRPRLTLLSGVDVWTCR